MNTTTNDPESAPRKETPMRTTHSSALAPFLALGGAALLVAALVAALALLTAAPVSGAALPIFGSAPAVVDAAPQDWCEEGTRGSVRHCEVRSLSGSLAGGALAVEGMSNGSIQVEGWNGREVRITARIRGRDTGSTSAAVDLVSQVSIDVRDGLVDVSGPRRGLFQRGGWTVDLRIQVPEGAELSLGTTNGSITVGSVGGAVRARATNGSITVRDAVGRVDARTTNGPVRVAVDGAVPAPRLDLRTTNGTVDLTLPADASVRVDASTTNGRITSDFALEIEGRRQNRAQGVLGGGQGETILRATNGSIRIQRAG
jgi:hypothetical protein